jgi:GxxExxY protein
MLNSTLREALVKENETGTAIVAAAMKVHTILGPGLLESAYRVCLAYELRNRGEVVRSEVPIRIRYGGLTVENGYRADLIVNGVVLVELKALEAILPVHRSQVVSYLRLGGYKLGYLLNFHVSHMRHGIARLVNHL